MQLQIIFPAALLYDRATGPLQTVGLSGDYEYFLVRRVGAVFAGSSGQTCFG